jgi:hypothetical protein
MELLDTSSNDISTDKSTLFLLGGVAMVVFGVGLIITNPVIRRYMSQLGVGNLAQAAIPDIERYFKLRTM